MNITSPGPSRSDAARRPVRRPGRIGRRGWLTTLLGVTFVTAVVTVTLGSEGVRGGGWSSLADILAAAMAPDLSPGFLAIALEAAVRTLAYAIAGMTVAIGIGVPGALVASGVLVRRPRVRAVSTATSRGALAFARAIHELIWALILVTAFGLSPIAGVLAIGVPYGGIIGRIVAERLQDVPPAALEALRSSGASPMQVLFYGRLPAAGADITSYLFYRFECAVRSAAVLSFVGLGGIGYRIELALADLRFDQVWTLFGFLALLVVAVDATAARARRWAFT